jgi:uncharacterized protein involved in exopolysaccharide biosynthesis
VKYAETLFEMLAKQYEAARLDEARTAAVIQVLDAAIEPDRKSSPKRGLIVLGATGLGFLGGAGYAIAAAAFAEIGREPGMRHRLATLGRLLKPSR